ncbi:hypothetical protein [Candidatus Methylacidithermus pantelleriae]|nr:hypothetical protein [Candidatus Methylacidithermus pantelleriae]
MSGREEIECLRRLCWRTCWSAGYRVLSVKFRQANPPEWSSAGVRGDLPWYGMGVYGFRNGSEELFPF